MENTDDNKANKIETVIVFLDSNLESYMQGGIDSFKKESGDVEEIKKLYATL